MLNDFSYLRAEPFHAMVSAALFQSVTLTADWKQLLILYFSKFRLVRETRKKKKKKASSPNTEQIAGKQDLTVWKLMADAFTSSLNVSLDANVSLCL